VPVNPDSVRAVFLAAVESTDPVERAEILKERCAGDAELRERVEALLRAHHEKTELPGGLRDVEGTRRNKRCQERMALPCVPGGFVREPTAKRGRAERFSTWDSCGRGSVGLRDGPFLV
jgi:hypothetical protein